MVTLYVDIGVHGYALSYWDGFDVKTIHNRQQESVIKGNEN